uniref:C-type lectin domain-containing protein n=1 Tax=Anas platyrhynchos TaxID=8839 RepID=A0A8B9QWP6_ANAPL
MELEVRKNTHPEQEEVLNPPRGEEYQYKWGNAGGRGIRIILKMLFFCLFFFCGCPCISPARFSHFTVVQQQSHSSHPQFSHMCPTPWIGFQSKCYYFSEDESNWNTSLEKCKAMEASLTSIDSLEDMAFIRRCKGQGNHWVGLHEEGNGQWRWTNGTAFNNWFEVRGGGPCAYINQEISSALCHTEKYWICSRPNNYVLWRQKISPE